MDAYTNLLRKGGNSAEGGWPGLDLLGHQDMGYCS